MKEKEPKLVAEAREKREDFFLAQNVWNKIKSLTVRPETEDDEKIGRFVFEKGNGFDIGFDVHLSHYPSVSVVSFHSTFLRESLVVRADGSFYSVDASLFDHRKKALLDLPPKKADRQDLEKFDEILDYCATNIKNKKPWNYGNTDQ